MESIFVIYVFGKITYELAWLINENVVSGVTKNLKAPTNEYLNKNSHGS